MRYKDCQCVYCNGVFTENDDAVTCPECGSPHHRECWFAENKCANEKLHGEGFAWKFPEELDPLKKLNEQKKDARSPFDTEFRFKNGERAVVCPHCNGLNYGNDAVCMRCGKPLSAERREGYTYRENSVSGADGNAPHEENSSETGNVSGDSEGFAGTAGMYGQIPFEASREYYERFGGLYPETPVAGIPAFEMAEYIGTKKSGRYIRKFAVAERFGKRFSVSIWAFIFGPLWFFYRKLYKEGLIFLLAYAFVTIVSGFCMVTTPAVDANKRMNEYIPQLINGEISVSEFAEIEEEILNSYTADDYTQADRIKLIVAEILSYCSIALSVVSGFAAENMYKKKIVKDINKLRSECHDMNSYMFALRNKGGVSVASAVLCGIAMTVIGIIGALPLYIAIF